MPKSFSKTRRQAGCKNQLAGRNAVAAHATSASKIRFKTRPSESRGRIDQQDQAEQSNDDSFAPFLGRATEETGEHRERGDGNVPPPPGGSGGET